MSITCQQCGEQNADGTLMCGMCGAVLKAPEAPVKTAPRPGPANRPMPAPPPTGARPNAAIPPTPPVRRPMQQRRQQYTEYGGFWIRFVAAFIDGIVILIPTAFLMPVIMKIATAGKGLSSGEGLTSAGIMMEFSPLLISWLYHTLMESSSAQGTLGKRAMGLTVADLDENRISFGRATGRFFSKAFLSGILLIGYIMAAFTDKNQALHDMIAGTIVLKKVQ